MALNSRLQASAGTSRAAAAASARVTRVPAGSVISSNRPSSTRLLQRQHAYNVYAHQQQGSEQRSGANSPLGQQQQQQGQQQQQQQHSSDEQEHHINPDEWALSYWHYQPWWLQPPMIIATGVAFIVASLILDNEELSKTALLAAGPVALYWGVFLFVLPKRFRSFAVDYIESHPEAEEAAREQQHQQVMELIQQQQQQQQDAQQQEQQNQH